MTDTTGGTDEPPTSGSLAARFVGRSVLVTGGASGIGLACALRLAAEGATTVVLLDPDAAVADLGAAGAVVVINAASVPAHTAQPARSTYNATKGAITSLTRCQAMDLAPRGIRVNSISPAWIWTPVVARMAGEEETARRAEWGAYHLLGRIGEVEEVAAAVAFLASDDASFITAVDLPIDGGYLAVGGEGVGQPDGGIYATLRDG